MINTTSMIHVGHQQMQFDLTAMQQAFSYIMHSQAVDYEVIKTGLNAIQNLADFLKDKEKKLGHLSHLAHLKNYMRCFQQNVVQAVFIQTLGKVDLQAENIFNPSPTKTLQSIEFSLKSNMIGKMVVLDLNQYIITPIAETLAEMEKAIAYTIKNRTDEVAVAKNASDASKIEIDCYKERDAAVLETPTELQLTQNPQEINERQALLNILEEIQLRGELLTRIQTAVQKYPGLGLTPLTTL